jgi:putative transposase
MLSVSRFHSLVKTIPRGVFEQAVAQSSADKHSKGFRSWDQLLAMLYAQYAGVTSLRELVSGFNAHASHHYHLGTGRLSRSTLADANAKRQSVVFSTLACTLMEAASRSVRREVRTVLNVIDSSSITLKGGGFEGWTAPTRTRNTQGVKLHLQLVAGEALPIHAAITASNVNDISAVQDWPLQPGERYVFDKGYCDYAWWQRITAAGSVFVTRFKRNAKLSVVAQRSLPAAAVETILSDEEVVLSNRVPRGGHRNPYTGRLRRIVIARPDHETPLVLATNDLQSDALQIAADYRSRWQIELFFKWIKQHLKIRRFLGESETAVRTQLLTALIAYLLMAIAHRASGAVCSLWETLMTLRASLFQRERTEASHYQRCRERKRAVAERQGVLFA